jgi:antirestriction protein
MGSASISVDEFQALEQKVLQTVELIKREREARAAAETARAAAEAEVAAVKTELAARKEELESRGQEIVALRQELAAAGDVNAEVQHLQREREAVRLRVEKMLASIDEIV